MQSRPSIFLILLRVFVRLGLGLVLLTALCVVVAGVSLHAHAAVDATLFVTDCSGETGPGRIGTVISSASAGDTIRFSCSGTIPITSTLSISTNNLTLDGSGQSVTLDGGNSTQVLSVNSGVTFTLNAFTIVHGLATFGGGLANGGTVSITNSTFANNSAGAGGFGGGLINFATVSISNSTFANNSASGQGGGLTNVGIMSITNSTFANNSAGAGSGGLWNETGTMTISNSTFANNSTPNNGGGLVNASGAMVSISTSTFANNSAGTDGGGLKNFGTVSITNSTFANNSAGVNNPAFFGGGGLENASGATVSISTSTFANNSASVSGTAFFGSGGGLENASGATMSIGGSIVANNIPNDCFGGGESDQGYNLESGTDCGFTGTGDLQNTPPKLDPNGLQNNGGPTQTFALEPDSAAVDHIPVGSSCPATDQRGVSRPQGPACDIGAFEMTAADGLTVMIHVVNSFHLSKSLQTSLDAELQAALNAVNAGHTAAACGALSAFISQVKTQSGKGLTVSQATQLINEATVIKTRLGC